MPFEQVQYHSYVGHRFHAFFDENRLNFSASVKSNKTFI